MKRLATMLVAAGFLGAMTVAQAGVPMGQTVPQTTPAQTTPMTAGQQVTPPPDAQPQQTQTQPTVPGTQKAQHAAISNQKKMAIIAGVVAGVVLLVAASGGGGGSHAPSGTTGTH